MRRNARPRVSVVLPVRNGRATLPAALESLAAQTMEDFETVVVDDGSCDDSSDVARSLGRELGLDLEVISSPHHGIASALNTGLSRARGACIARMDADDLSHPRRLELQAAHLADHPDTGLVSCRVGYGGDREAQQGYARYVDWTNSLLSDADIRLGRFVESPLAHPSVMFRAEIPARHGSYAQGPFPEDYELWLRWLEAGVVMQKLPRVLLTWNDPPDRLSRTDPRYATEAFYRVKAEYLARWLARHNPHHPDIVLIGSGRTTRKRARMLQKRGVDITAYVDIDPRKVGHLIEGRWVVHRDRIEPPGRCFLVSYVASRFAREEIRAFLEARGHEMGRDFILAA